MPSVFVYSAGQAAAGHFERTVQNGLTLTSLESLLGNDFYKRLESAYPDGTCYLWGDRGGDHGRQYWSQIKDGDLALCYRNRRIAAASTVVATIESEAAGITAWPDATTDPYRLLFFLSKPVWTDVLVASMPEYFGRVYQGLRRLPKSPQILQDFGTLDNFVRVGLLGQGLRDDEAADQLPAYEPDGTDHRELAQRQIRARRGQRQFRDTLRARYDSRCVISGSRIVAILEAAHINPYRGDNDNHPENGLLLRADLHTLFDLNMIGIEPETLKVHLVDEVVDEYKEINGVTIQCNADSRPSVSAIKTRWVEFRRGHIAQPRSGV